MGQGWLLTGRLTVLQQLLLPQLVSEVILDIIIVPVVLPHVCVFVLLQIFVDGICWELFKLIIFLQETEVNLSVSFLLSHLDILSYLQLKWFSVMREELFQVIIISRVAELNSPAKPLYIAALRISCCLKEDDRFVFENNDVIFLSPFYFLTFQTRKIFFNIILYVSDFILSY